MERVRRLCEFTTGPDATCAADGVEYDARNFLGLPKGDRDAPPVPGAVVLATRAEGDMRTTFDRFTHVAVGISVAFDFVGGT